MIRGEDHSTKWLQNWPLSYAYLQFPEIPNKILFPIIAHAYYVRYRSRKGTVNRSRNISVHGQEVNIDFWVVKNLDPGRERMYRVNGSDLP